MNWFENYNILVSFIGIQSCTRSNVERIKNGFFKDKLKYYIEYGIIRIDEKSDRRNDMISLDYNGLKLYRQEIKIEDIIDTEGKK